METDKMKRTWEKDILLGTAVGDALGFPVQFLDRATVQKEPVTGMHPWHSVWSDDTSLSLCLADSLCGGYDLQDIGNKFVDWLYEGLWTPKGEAFDIGITTDRAISRLANGYPPREAGMDRERDNGNGSLMRISPLVPAIRGFGREEQERRIAEVSSLTHRHPRSVLACIFLCGFELACMEGQGRRLLILNGSFIWTMPASRRFPSRMSGRGAMSWRRWKPACGVYSTMIITGTVCCMR